MGISSLNVRVDCTQAGLGKRLGDTTSSQRTGDIGLDWNWRCRVAAAVSASLCYRSAARDKRDYAVIRWILNYVVGHIAEVAFVGDAVTSTHSPFPVSERIECKADT